MCQVGVEQVNGNLPKDFPREVLNEPDEIAIVYTQVGLFEKGVRLSPKMGAKPEHEQRSLTPT